LSNVLREAVFDVVEISDEGVCERKQALEA